MMGAQDGDRLPSGTEGTVQAADGRTLAYLEVGAPEGPLVIHNHGGPSSRIEARLFAAAAARNGLRLVCVDRPGIGRSSPRRDRSFAGWAEDMTAVADALGHRAFGVTGWSEGGPSALAAAAYVEPGRLRHVANIAGGCYGTFGANWAARHLSGADALGGFLALHFEPGFHLMYGAIGLTAEHFRTTYLDALRKSVTDYDRRQLAQPGVAPAFSDASAECFAQGSEGLVRDAEILYRAWPFDVSAIARPVHFWQGTIDTLVPPVINRTIADRMPGSVWHEVADAGHFVAVGSADAILRTAAEDLAG